MNNKGEMNQKNLVLFFNLLPLHYKQPVDRWAVMTLYPGLFSSIVYLPLVHWRTTTDPSRGTRNCRLVPITKELLINLSLFKWEESCFYQHVSWPKGSKWWDMNQDRDRGRASAFSTKTDGRQEGGWFLGNSGWVCLEWIVDLTNVITIFQPMSKSLLYQLGEVRPGNARFGWRRASSPTGRQREVVWTPSVAWAYLAMFFKVQILLYSWIF